MTAATAVQHCPICSGALERDGICLACFFNEALSAADVASSSAGQTDVGRAYASLGRMQLPCKFAGHLLLTREIAAGGMGIVYEAEDQRLKRTVALKVIRAAAFARPEDLVRFRAEAEAAAHLDHPNIVPIYEMGDVDGVPFFTMRLMDGPSLAERLAADGQSLSAREAAALMSKVARAVQHAHERGVLHRDLKPANILLDDNGEPHLTDFGLAKLLDADSDLTRSQAHLGTPHYMSPEQAAGRTREITTASDVWALGVILYQMLTRRLPFTGESSVAVMQQIVSAEPLPLSRDKLDPDLATLIARCLEKDPARRLPGAAFLADELDRWLRGEPIRSRPISPLERTRKWLRLHRAAAAAIFIAGLALIGGGGVAVWQWAQAVRARDEMQHQLKESQAATDLILKVVEVMNPKDAGPLTSKEEVLREFMQKVETFDGDPRRRIKLLTEAGRHLPQGENASTYERAFQIARQVLDADDAELWRLRFLRASTQPARGAEGELSLVPELRLIYEWHRDHLGPDDPATIRAMHSLARRETYVGGHEEALRLLELIKQHLDQHPGENTLRTTVFNIDYANALFQNGLEDEALELGRSNCRLVQEQLNSDRSHDAARACHYHAKHCLRADLQEEAVRAMQQSLRIYWQYEGPASEGASEALRFLLDLQRGLKDTEGLLATHRDVVRAFDQKLGPTNSETLKQVAECLRALETAQHLDEADHLGQQWLQRVRDFDGTAPPAASDLLVAHAELLSHAQQWSRAEPEFREVIALKEAHASNKWQVFADRVSLAEVLVPQGKHTEALALLQNSIQALEASHEADKDIDATYLPKARKLLEQAKQEKPAS